MVSFLKDKHIFISYRRDDTEDAAHRLYQKLIELGVEKNTIFFDRHNIPGGARFPDRLREKLEQSEVILVLIGKRYFTPDNKTGKSRLPSKAGHQTMCLATCTWVTGWPCFP